MHVRTEVGIRAYPVPPLGLLDEQHVLETHAVGKVEEPLAQAMQDTRATGD